MAKNPPARGSIREILLLLLAASLTCLLLFLLLLVGEGLCRVFSDISFRGNSRTLFVADAWGSSMGNARSATNISFGVEVYTDELGFRVPRGTAAGGAQYERSLLILGDSVGFGAGVEDERTFSGLLRAQNPDTRIYNSSVIGYFTHDYENVIDHFPWAERGVDRVVLVYCLNDVSAASAQRIDAHLATGAGRPRAETAPQPATAEAPTEGGLVGAMKSISLISQLNEFLRTRSKLYLLTISILADPRPRQWAAVQQLYEEDNAAAFEESMRPLLAIADKLGRRGAELTIVILPFSPQLTSDDPAAWLPQRKLAEVFERHGIDYVDAQSAFADQASDPDELFLPFDPMHLSEQGHRVVAEIITRHLGLTG